MNADRFAYLKARHLRDELQYTEISELIVMLDAANDALLSLAPLPWGDDKTRKASDAAHETKGRTK